MDRKLTRVRIASYAAALAVTALVLLAAGLYRVDARLDERGDVAVSAILDSPQHRQTTPPPRIASGAPRVALSTAANSEDDDVRLWRYGGRGEIVFAYAAQFDRCSEARSKHKDEADCPSWRETRTYVLVQNPAAPLELSVGRHAG